MTADGRISIAGLNSKNVEYIGKAFHEISKWFILIKISKNIKYLDSSKCYIKDFILSFYRF